MAEITPLRPGHWTVEAHLHDFDVRGAVVAGSRRAVVWDTLARPRDMAGVAELVPDLPLTVVYSHGDWDHVWGTAGLGRPWEEVVSHRIGLDRFGRELPAELEAMRATAPDTLVGFVPEWGVLLAGDAVETPLPFLNEGSPLEAWAAALENWAGSGEVDTVIPSHGRTGGPELLSATAGYLRALMQGDDPALPDGELTPFYRETHTANLDIARR